LVFENYLNILNDKDNLTLSKFRTTNHKLPVENGRWKNIARENRICPLCNNGEIGDEFHYLFKCQYFSNQRKIYIKKNIRINPNIIKYKLLMTSTSKITSLLEESPKERIQKDKQRPSRIYKDKLPPSPLKLVVTVLK
jgi:hypothetical protein